MSENKNEIIDVEVEEEVIETIPSEPIEEVHEEKYFHSDEKIDEMVTTLSEELKANDYSANAKCQNLAKEIAENSKEYLDNNTYLWVMYTYAMKYKQEENKNAERFCFIRMMKVLDASEGKGKKQKALTFNPINISETMRNEVSEKTAFMKIAAKSLKKQFLLMELVMMLIFVGLMYFIFHYSFLVTLGFCALLLMVNYMMTYRSLFERYYKEQTEASKGHCQDQELIDFDLPVLLS